MYGPVRVGAKRDDLESRVNTHHGACSSEKTLDSQVGKMTWRLTSVFLTGYPSDGVKGTWTECTQWRRQRLPTAQKHGLPLTKANLALASAERSACQMQGPSWGP